MKVVLHPPKLIVNRALKIDSMLKRVRILGNLTIRAKRYKRKLME